MLRESPPLLRMRDYAIFNSRPSPSFRLLHYMYREPVLKETPPAACYVSYLGLGPSLCELQSEPRFSPHYFQP